MSASKDDFSMSTLSLASNDSSHEDWDRSESDIHAHLETNGEQSTTPRNSVVFPAAGAEETPSKDVQGKGRRSLSELLRLHAENGTNVVFSPEEASRVAEVLHQWINSGSSPYEGEDDFFTRSQDDSSLASKRSPSAAAESNSRPRGQSESVVISRTLSSSNLSSS